ncbi:hypothetical protein [Haladaptatus halobius]|uniref:hypothetical protein n=1 Tax=Haladaptatus halobius TaxID=2884875 RepID=UPI001D0AC39A|nr:hypothetical protein [Haladaptatus halobius]
MSAAIFYIGVFVNNTTGFLLQGAGLGGTILFARLAGQKIGSYWWTIIALTPLLVLLKFSVPFWHRYTFSPYWLSSALEHMIEVVGFIGIPSLFFFLYLGPLFPFALFFDAQRMQDADIPWNPSPVLYGILGVPVVGPAPGDILRHLSEP